MDVAQLFSPSVMVIGTTVRSTRTAHIAPIYLALNLRRWREVESSILVIL